MSRSPFDRFKPAADAARTADREEQAELLRDMVGDPFRPVRLDRSRLTPEMVRLAQEMYDRRVKCAPGIGSPAVCVISGRPRELSPWFSSDFVDGSSLDWPCFTQSAGEPIQAAHFTYRQTFAFSV